MKNELHKVNIINSATEDQIAVLKVPRIPVRGDVLLIRHNKEQPKFDDCFVVLAISFNYNSNFEYTSTTVVVKRSE